MDRAIDLTPSYNTEEKEVSTKAAYEAKYGTTDAYELEAMEPEDLQNALIEDIEEVLDIEAYNAELEREVEDAVAVKIMKDAVTEFMKTYAPDQKST